MDLNKAEELCKELMNKHGLSHWKFQYDNSIRRFGVCKYNTYNESGVIGLSKKLVAVNEEKQVRDTILHEIAHALVGPSRNPHGEIWRNKALEIGCNGERCGYMNAPKKYIGHCRNCGKECQKNRRIKVACGKCCKQFNNNRFSEQFLIIWK